MTFFLPTDWAGRVHLGADVRLILDAAPQFVIPAKVTFVANVAQFTPKTVETAQDARSLMFGILGARRFPNLFKKHIRDIKTGLPGMAYVQLDSQATWPANLIENSAHVGRSTPKAPGYIAPGCATNGRGAALRQDLRAR